MITINLGEIEESQKFEFLVSGERRLALCFNPRNMSVQIPNGNDVNPLTISNTPGSFFLRATYEDK